MIYLNFLVAIDFLFKLNNRRIAKFENCRTRNEIFIKFIYIYYIYYLHTNDINCLEKMFFN